MDGMREVSGDLEGVVRAFGTDRVGMVEAGGATSGGRTEAMVLEALVV